MEDVLTHLDVVLQITEQERSSGGTPYTGLVYDEMIRQSWETRANRRDGTFTLAKAVAEIHQQTLAAARARVATTLQSAGLQDAHVDKTKPTAGAATDAESLVAKQQAALDALVKKTEAQTKALQNQRSPGAGGAGSSQELVPWSGGASRRGGSDAGNQGEPSKRYMKKRNFFAQQKDRRTQYGRPAKQWKQY